MKAQTVKRPKIICHMMTSVDGKIIGSFMETNTANIVGEEYERINDFYNSDAWLCGRVTTDENFTFYREPELNMNALTVDGGDYIACNDARMYYVSADSSGKIGWTSNTLKYENRLAAHIIEILTERVSNLYLDFLRKMKISYVIAGQEHLDCTLACEKLYSLFGIKTLVLSGGGYINGSFLNEGLIDELSLLITPATDSMSDTVTLFEKSDYLPDKTPTEFSLIDVQKTKGDGIWIRYKTKKQK